MVVQLRAGAPETELMLALRGRERTLGVRFAQGTSRAFVVGATESADYVLEGSGCNALEFSVERQGDNLVLLSAYRGRGLRVNGETISGPTVLPEFATIEFGSRQLFSRLYARTLLGTNEPPSAALWLLPEEQLPPDCFRGAPALTPMALLEGGATPTAPVDAATTVHVPAISTDREPTTIAPAMTVAIDAAEVMGVFGTAGFPAPTRAVTSPAYGPTGTAVVTTLSVEAAQALVPREPQGTSSDGASVAPAPKPESAVARIVPKGLGAARVAVEVAKAALAAQDKPSDGAKPSDGTKPSDGAKPSDDAKPSDGAKSVAAHFQAATREFSGVSLPIAGIAARAGLAPVPAVGAPRHPTRLEQVGLWARERPLGAAVIAVTSGLVVALVAAMVYRGLTRGEASAPSVTRPSGAGAAMPSAVSSQAQPNTDVAVAAPAAAASVASTRGVVVLELEGEAKLLANQAIEHLTAGRYSDALRSYERLLESSPNSEVAGVAARLLRARLAKECEPKVGEHPQASRCPEFLP